MAFYNTTNRLDIRTVDAGVYEGFNPVVAVSTKFLIMVLVIFLIAMPEASGRALAAMKNITLAMFAGWYIYLMAAFVFFCLILVFLPVSGRIKLGHDDSVPDHSTQSWLAMMFCAGIGVGILVFSVSEPISHFTNNPDIIAGLVARRPRQAWFRRSGSFSCTGGFRPGLVMPWSDWRWVWPATASINR